MKKEIKAMDYLKHLPEDVRLVVATELAAAGVEEKDCVIERTSHKSTMMDQPDGEADGTASGWASTRMVDYSQDVIVPEGIRLDAFNRNPVMFWAHRSSDMPIAKATSSTIDPMGLRIGIKFACAENPEAAMVYRLVKGGYLKGLSVGFIALKGLVKGQQGFEEENTLLRQRWPEYDGSARRIIQKMLLLEVSCVSIGDNSSAVMTSVKGLSQDDMPIIKKLGLDCKPADEVDESKEVKPPVIKVVKEPLAIPSIKVVAPRITVVKSMEEATRRGRIAYA